MRFLKSIINKIIPKETQGKIVDRINVIGGWKKLESPTLSTETECLTCGSKEHYAPVIDPADKQSSRVWLCGNPVCVTMRLENCLKATTTPPTSKRAVLWPLWCELNGIGDVHHNVRFESIQQSAAKIAYMLKFIEKPHGIIYMQGDAGTGKTYAAMGMCELFTKKSTDCMFISQKQLMVKWLETFKSDFNAHFFERISRVELLVIDDFGTSEVSPGFMSYFMDLIDKRLQWSNRGTVITTNLKDDAFSNYCGEALTDRIKTGQLFIFEDKSRRIKTPL